MPVGAIDNSPNLRAMKVYFYTISGKSVLLLNNVCEYVYLCTHAYTHAHIFFSLMGIVSLMD